ncbi:MAG TPA: DUF3667 domain-containing protein [Steroidobacteraceae bacterium]|nr:DUF3667 domain-containing protein [Steroidobacteraceae bacterium]
MSGGEQAAASCAGCGATLHGEFCSDCGQRRSARLSFRRSLQEGWAQLVDFDFALARTIAGLSTRPGETVLEYLGGRRSRYSNPFRYAFVITTVTVIAINLLDIDVTVPGVPLDSEREQAAVRLLVSLMAYLFFPAILVLALLQRWLARTDRFNYAEILVFDAYCLSHASLWTIAVGAFIPINSPTGIALLMAGQLAYIAWCIRGFRGVGWPSAAGRSAALAVGYIALFNLIGLLLVNLAALAGLL